jgi:hypothetical protein
MYTRNFLLHGALALMLSLTMSLCFFIKKIVSSLTPYDVWPQECSFHPPTYPAPPLWAVHQYVHCTSQTQKVMGTFPKIVKITEYILNNAVIN